MTLLLTYNSYILHNLGGEVQELPASTVEPGVVNHPRPFLLINAHFNEVRVRTQVLIPQEQLDMIDNSLGAQFDKDSVITGSGGGGLRDCVSCIAIFHVVVVHITIEKGILHFTLHDHCSHFACC